MNLRQLIFGMALLIYIVNYERFMKTPVPKGDVSRKAYILG